MALQSQVERIVRGRIKDRKIVEIETTQAIATRLTDWAKMFAFFVGIPTAVLLLILATLGPLADAAPLLELQGGS
jgi:hypothetical protein